MLKQEKHARYLKTRELGEGSFGIVHEAKDVETQEIVAVKKIRQIGKEDGIHASTVREIKILRELKHDYIIQVRALQ